ncbi:unnamed protein product [Mortierella alpina]
MSVVDAVSTAALVGIVELDVELTLAVEFQETPVRPTMILVKEDQSSAPMQMLLERVQRGFPLFQSAAEVQSDGAHLWPSNAPQGSLELAVC